jgi:hypothetical protein
LGTNVVLITVADPYGERSYSTNHIEVLDRTPPQIVIQPRSQTNTVGASTSLSVAAAACTPLAFLWISNNIALTTQTNATLILSNLELSAAGSYAVVVTAAGGSVTSAVVTLTISAPQASAGVAVNSVGRVALNFTGVPGTTYILEAAPNLSFPISWLGIATNKLGSNGVWELTDERATNFSQQFYRFLFSP